MKKIIFIRHAETDLAGTFCGHSDPPLNARGTLQLAGLQGSLTTEKIETIVSSDLLRAQQTAASLQSLQEVPVILDTNLREIHFGAWEGLTWHEIEAAYPSESLLWLEQFPDRVAPRGENYAAFCARVRTALNGILASPHASIAVVTHAGVLRVALQDLMGCSFLEAQSRQIPYGAYFVYEQATTR